MINLFNIASGSLDLEDLGMMLLIILILLAQGLIVVWLLRRLVTAVGRVVRSWRRGRFQRAQYRRCASR